MPEYRAAPPETSLLSYEITALPIVLICNDIPTKSPIAFRTGIVNAIAQVKKRSEFSIYHCQSSCYEPLRITTLHQRQILNEVTRFLTASALERSPFPFPTPDSPLPPFPHLCDNQKQPKKTSILRPVADFNLLGETHITHGDPPL